MKKNKKNDDFIYDNDVKEVGLEQAYFNAVHRLHHQCLIIAISAALAGLFCYFQSFPSIWHFAGGFAIAFVVAYVLFWVVSGLILSAILLTTHQYTKHVKLWIYYTISALLPIIITFLVIISKNHESW